MIEVVLPAEGGPELDVNTVVTLAERLDVRLMSEPFESPIEMKVKLANNLIFCGRKKARKTTKST